MARKARKRARDGSDFLKAFGTAFEVWKAITDTVLSIGGSDEHVRSLIGDKARLVSIATIIIGAGISELPPDHYRVPVSYEMLSRTELGGEFSGEGSVSVLFDGRPWKKHAACVGIDETPGNRVFFVKHFNRVFNNEREIEDAIAEMGRQGYRPATHHEAIAFAKTHPEPQWQFWIVALGSFALCVTGGYRYVAVLGADGGRRLLTGFWFDDRWSSDYRFLFVRK
jgi:hypothetical protein